MGQTYHVDCVVGLLRTLNFRFSVSSVGPTEIDNVLFA